MQNTFQTQYTLIDRARNLRDEEAWQKLVLMYRRFIFYILTRMNVNAADRDDLSQQIFIKLTRGLDRYDRGKARFRTWLTVIVRNVVINYFNKQSRSIFRLSSDDYGDAKAEVICSADIDELIEEEWAAFVSNLAMERVRKTVRGRAVEVFELGLDGVPAAEIAARTGLGVASVYTLKKRVKQRLYEEIRALKVELEYA